MKKEFNPDLIDLKKYEAGLLSTKKNNKPFVPVKPIANFYPGYSDEELAIMVDNRQKAKEIYNRIIEP